MADTFDWYYPQPVTTTEEATDDIAQLPEPTPTPTVETGDGGSWAATGVARTFGQGADIDINKLSTVDPATIQFSDFNDYLSSRGLPTREGFFSGTDFSSLGTQSGPSSNKMAGVATALTGDAMMGLVGSAFGPTREVKDPTGTSSRYIHESGPFNRIASMSIAEEFRDLGAIKDAWEKNPNGTTKENGFIMHIDGRPVYRMPGSAYYKHKLNGVGEISQLQGKNLEKLAAAKTVFNALKARIESGGNFDDVKDADYDTFVSTPNGGYNLSGSFNYGGETTSRYGNMEDLVSLGDQMFSHVTDPNAQAQAAARKSYATAVIEGLRSMPSTATSAQRMAHIKGIVDMSMGLKPTTSAISSVVSPSAKLTGTAGTPTSYAEFAAKLDKQYEGGGSDDFGFTADDVAAGRDDPAGGVGEGSFGRSDGMGDDNDPMDWATGGTIGYAWGGDIDDASDDEMGDAETMSSSYSADPDSFADEDAGMYDGGNDDGGDSSDKRPPSTKPSEKMVAAFQRDIVKELRGMSLTPDQRYMVNEMAGRLGMDPADPNAPKAPEKTESFLETPAGSFLSKAASAGMQALMLQAIGIPLGFAQGAMIPGDQSTQAGEPVLTANEVMQGKESGFIQAPPSQVSEAATVADDVAMNGDVGGEIINASAVMEAGEADIAKMIADAEKYARANGIEIADDGEKNDIRVSKGEVYIKKDLANIIGRDKIRKINNRGKKDTRRKIKETQMAAEGGFIKKKYADGGEVQVTGKEYMQQGISSLQALPAWVTGTLGDVNEALAQSKAYRDKYKPRDNDASEDTLRHILVAGYMHNKPGKVSRYFGNMASRWLDDRELGPDKEENEIDINNNAFGRALRRAYPDRKAFTQKAIEIVRSLSKGDAVEIEGYKPLLSKGR